MKKVRKHAAAKAGAESRTPAYLHARKMSRFLAVVMCVFLLIVSTIYVREPFAIGVGVLAAIPWLVLAMARGFPGLYGIDDFGNSAVRVDLFPLMVAPGLGLAIHAAITVYLVRWSPVFLFAPIGGMVMAGAAALASPAVRKSMPVCFAYAVFMSAYGSGVAVFGNVFFDEAAPQVFARTILGKRTNSIGKYNAIHYDKIAPWGPYAEPNEVEVSREFDDPKKMGDTVCVYLHPGALGLPWFTAGDCPHTPAP
jgi:multidrug transporter EmrE-like cation transporter